MPNYTFEHKESGEIEDWNLTIAEYEIVEKKLIEDGWRRLWFPVAIKDGGTGKSKY